MDVSAKDLTTKEHEVILMTVCQPDDARKLSNLHRKIRFVGSARYKWCTCLQVADALRDAGLSW